MPRPRTKAADYKRMTLRLPPDMLETLQEQAEALGRTINTHTLRVLQDGLEIEKPLPSSERKARTGVDKSPR